MRELVGEDEIVRPGERGDHADVGEVAGAEQASGFGVFGAGKRLLQQDMFRVIAGDQPGGAGAGAPTPGGLDRGGDYVGMAGEAQRGIAGEREEALTVALHPGWGGAEGRREVAALGGGLKGGELGGGESG